MLYIGADHRGYNLKEKIKHWLSEWSLDYEDVGAFKLNENDDFTDFAKKVAQDIGGNDKGIVICGSGVGVDEVANKFKGVRSGLAINEEQIRAARNDDDINVLALAADYTSEEDAKKIVSVFLETEFSGEEKYARRVKEIDKLEN